MSDMTRAVSIDESNHDSSDSESMEVDISNICNSQMPEQPINNDQRTYTFKSIRFESLEQFPEHQCVQNTHKSQILSMR